MRSKEVLSSTFNMSLGFIPIICTILFNRFVTQDAAIYMGTAIGIAYTLYNVKVQTIKIPNFILYLSTGILSLLSLATFVPGNYIPVHALPLTLEVSMLIPMMILFLHKRRFMNYFASKQHPCARRVFTQGANSSIVAARVVLMLGTIHFLIISVCLIFSSGGLDSQLKTILYSYIPFVVFVFTIIINQVGIRYFNKLMANVEYVPIVDTTGNVIGKKLAIEALNYKNNYLVPVIRIAIIIKGKLFLSTRSNKSCFDRGKTDHLLECYLRFNETLADAVKRLVKQTFPGAEGLKPDFSIFYSFKSKPTNRLVYLFILEIDEDSILSSPYFKDEKLWSIKEIENNLNKNIFSECFEKEYEHIKTVIDTREKYREF